MSKGIRYILLAIVLTLGTFRASAQFYSWGADPESMHWNKIKGQKIDIIYPDTARNLAYKLFCYTKAVQPDIGFGFRHGPMNIPFVVHPENFSSNGMVMWLPKRVEILSSPAIDGYSMPWLKQLAAHEYRHAVQYNNINRGVVRVFSYLLGQQSSTIGLLFMPLWAIEGDAVLSETAMSSFGRALQPSFTIDYRAAGDFTKQRKNTDKWFCGSYREHIPDHYHIGYQITAYADTKYDENIWNKIVRYAVRNPYVFATSAVAMKKYYNTNTNNLIRETFGDLNAYWDSLPKVDDSAERIAVPPSRSFTTYSHPMYIDGDKKIVSFKESLDTCSEIVVTDTENGSEKRLCHTGRISTRPTTDGRRIWWTEYRRSTLFAERVNSKLCYADLDRGKPRTVRKYRNILYPTAIDSLELAWVEYNPDGTYAILRGDVANRYFRAEIPSDIEIHSLAYDNFTRKLYFIATDDSGMWLGRVNDDRTISHVTEGAYITLSNLRAHNGVLYFGSIASGKDEAHCYDLAEGREYRLTTSTYGSFSPSPNADGSEAVVSTYDKSGYRLARQRIIRDSLHAVAPSRLPVNLVNPPRRKWNVINLDTVRFAGRDSVETVRNNRSRHFSKFTHLFNVHSWAPASYDPYEFTEEGQFDFNLGVTLMSQSLLSSAEGFVTWGWNKDEGSFYKGTLRYYGLGVNIGFSASYGGTQRMYTAYSYQKNEETGKYELVFPERPKLDKYYNIQTSVLLPLYLQSGYHTRYLSVSAVWNYSNGLVAKMSNWKASGYNITNLAKIGFSEGMHTLQFGIGYQSTVQPSHKDFASPLGCALNLSYALNPADAHFSNLVALYAKGWLPGFAPHNSLTLAMAYQTSIGGFKSDNTISSFSFNSSRLIPRGFSSAEIQSRNYLALSLNYGFPLCYPEGGIPSILYFKRIRLNLGFDYASFDSPYFRITENPSDGSYKVSSEIRRKSLYAYGGDITFDVNLFRMPAAATTAVTISIYKPNKKGMYISAGLGLPF